MVKISLFRRRPVVAPVPQPTEADIQRMVYDLVRERVLHAVGPNGSFAITMRRGDTDDSFFSTTFAESMAWDVARSVHTPVVPTVVTVVPSAPAIPTDPVVAAIERHR